MKNAVMTALCMILVLLLAASQRDLGPCQSAIPYGVHADGRKEDGKSVLIQPPSSQKSVKDARMLLKSGATGDRTNDPETPLFIAPRTGNGSSVQLFLKYEAHPNLATRSGETAMIGDTDSGTTEVFRLLLQRRAGPAVRNCEGVATLIKPVKQGNLEIVQALVSSGVDVSACDRNGETTLRMDTAIGYQETAAVLPVTGAENSVPSPYG